MPPYILMPPVCLDAPHVWMTPCLNTLLYVRVMFGCPLYIHNTKKACFVTLKGAHMPHTFGCSHMFGWPPVCLNAPICVDTPYV